MDVFVEEENAFKVDPAVHLRKISVADLAFS